MSGKQLISAQRIEVGPVGKTLAVLQPGGPTLVVGSPRSVAAIDWTLLSGVVEVLDCARPHNPLSSVYEAAEVAKRIRPTTVIAIGGASAVDLGKATVEAVPAELVAIPTTLGGSEMSRVYGFRRPGGTKDGGSSGRLLPGTVCYDPGLLSGLPGPILFASGVNALAHAIEAHYARREHWVGTAAAVSAGSALPVLLAGAADRRDESVHLALLTAASQAGFAMNTRGMGLHHAMCHVLGGVTGIGHAAINVAVLPAAVTVNRQLAGPAVDGTLAAMRIADIAGLVRDLAKAYGTSVTLRELDVRPEQLETARATVLDSHHLANNPAPVTEDDVARAFDLAYYGVAS
jgi:maleylacetate reductase